MVVTGFYNMFQNPLTLFCAVHAHDNHKQVVGLIFKGTVFVIKLIYNTTWKLMPWLVDLGSIRTGK